ncbi:MAG: dihydrodipicolinate synthase family protein, partial [Chloroflexota bacterium]|nr:dihydrodipicolinate synthase family protein [Chloroflexota bacterium]
MVRRSPSTFVISLTPFDRQERLDEDGLRAHYRRLRDSGIGVYVVGGGSGEAYTLSPDEQRRILRIAAEELKGKVPVRAMGVEPRTADQMVEFSRMVADAGLDATQVYSLDMGHGHKPHPHEVEQYFVDILSSVHLPAVISTHQSVGYFLSIDLLKRLVDRFENVIGINVTNQDVTYLAALTDAMPERVEIHVGGPIQALTALALGASGYLSSEGNTAPRLCQSVIEHYRAGNFRAAEDAFGRVIRLFSLLMGAGGMRATKAALGLYGLPGGIPRRPRL